MCHAPWCSEGPALQLVGAGTATANLDLPRHQCLEGSSRQPRRVSLSEKGVPHRPCFWGTKEQRGFESPIEFPGAPVRVGGEWCPRGSWQAGTAPGGGDPGFCRSVWGAQDTVENRCWREALHRGAGLRGAARDGSVCPAVVSTRQQLQVPGPLLLQPRPPPPAPAVPEGKGAGGGTSGGRQAHGRPKKEKLQARGGCSEPGWKPPTAFIHLEMK